MQFPSDFGDFSGLTFEEVFVKLPKWVEFVQETWTDNCTGLFRGLRDFIREKLSIDENVRAHESRCREFCKMHDEVPRYLLKYRT